MFKEWGQPANRHRIAILNAFAVLGIQQYQVEERTDILGIAQKIYRNLGDVNSLRLRQTQDRLRGWIRESFDDFPDALKNRPDAEDTVQDFYVFMRTLKRLWDNIGEHRVPAGLAPIDPPAWTAFPFPPGPRVPPGSGPPAPPPPPPPTNIVQDNAMIQWGKLAPEEDFQLIGFDQAQVTEYINSKNTEWTNRLQAYQQRVANAQATLAANPARCPPATHRHFQTMLNDVLQEWNTWMGNSSTWIQNWWQAVQAAQEQTVRVQLTVLVLVEEELIHKSNWIMTDQLYQWENVPSPAEREQRHLWLEWGFDFNSPLIRYDVPIGIISRNGGLLSRINLRDLLNEPKNPRYKCPGRPWVRAESLRVSALIEVLKATGFMQEGQHLLLYQWQPTEELESKTIWHDMDFQVEIMNHMRLKHPIFCGRQTLNERARPVRRQDMPGYALRIAGTPLSTGQTPPAPNNPVHAYDIKKRIRDIADTEEREGILALFEGPLTPPPPPTAEDRRDTAETLESGRPGNASGSAVAGPSGTYAVDGPSETYTIEPTMPGVFVPERAPRKRTRNDGNGDGGDPMDVDSDGGKGKRKATSVQDPGSDSGSKRRKDA